LIFESGSTPNLYRYTGEQWDPDLGHYFLRARYYEPDRGRFWTMDSFEGVQTDPLSLHKYLYAHGNPANNIDPTGEYTLNQIMVASAVVATISNIAIGSAYLLFKSTGVGQAAGDRWVACMERKLASVALLITLSARNIAGSIPKILVEQAAGPGASRYTSIARLLSINRVARPYSTLYANWLKGRMVIGGKTTVAIANVVYAAGSSYVFISAISCATEEGG